MYVIEKLQTQKLDKIRVLLDYDFLHYPLLKLQQILNPRSTYGVRRQRQGHGSNGPNQGGNRRSWN